MVILSENRIILGGKSETIREFKVWFQTPAGLFTEMLDAIFKCKQNDWPEQVIKPVCVAVGETLYEII